MQQRTDYHERLHNSILGNVNSVTISIVGGVVA